MPKKQQDVINDVEDTAAAPTLPSAPIPGLTAGRMVHYVLSQDKHRPAIITAVEDNIDGTVDLVVFMDGSNDGFASDNCAQWSVGVEYSEFAIPGTWHFIEKA